MATCQVLRLARLALLCFAGQVAAQCYLEDANAACAVCWKTTSAGVTTFKECPTGAVSIVFTEPLPETMEEGIEYPVKYTLDVDTAQLDVRLKTAKGKPYHVPHSNIHSCIASRGACTPFVSNSPGLSTHTPALVGNMSISNVTHLVTEFDTTVKLTIEQYTIIAHNRFYVPDTLQDNTQSCYPNCLTKYDVAIGISREVVAVTADTSTDAYIGTGLVGFLILASTISIAWAAYTGKLDLDTILRALTREEVVICVELVMGVGDIIAFTISIQEEILQDNALVDIIPAALFFCATGWIVSLYGAFEDTRLLYRIIQQHRASPTYFRKKSSVILDHLGEGEGSAELSMTLSDSIAGKAMILEYEVASRERKQQYISIMTLLFEDVPLTVVGIYVLIMGEEVQMVVVFALALSSILLGSKCAGLGSFVTTSKRYSKAKAALEAVAKGEHELQETAHELKKMQDEPDIQVQPPSTEASSNADTSSIKHAADAAGEMPANENADLAAFEDTVSIKVETSAAPSDFRQKFDMMEDEEMHVCNL